MCCTFEDVSLRSLGAGRCGLKVCSPPPLFIFRSCAEVVLRDKAFGGDSGHAGDSARRLVSLQKETLRDCCHLTLHEGHKSAVICKPWKGLTRTQLSSREPLELSEASVCCGRSWRQICTSISCLSSAALVSSQVSKN